MERNLSLCLLVAAALCGCFSGRADAFSVPQLQNPTTDLKTKTAFRTNKDAAVKQGTSFVASLAFAAVMFTGTPVTWADEYGVEKEAPTIFTGETVEVSSKSGRVKHIAR
jgi:hypothetical protein